MTAREHVTTFLFEKEKQPHFSTHSNKPTKAREDRSKKDSKKECESGASVEKQILVEVENRLNIWTLVEIHYYGS